MAKKNGKKKNTRRADAAANTIVRDEAVEVDTDIFEEEPELSFAEKAINYATLALSLLLLGGSLVFWWVVAKHLLFNPGNLVDARQMSAVLITCGIIPAVVSLVQSLLHRPINIERWLICMCLSGAAAALCVVVYQLWIRGVPFTLAEFPTLICCTVSGCALPAVICLGIRRLAVAAAPYLKPPAPYTRETWEQVRQDILSLTDI